MEPWLIITLIIAAVVVLGIIAFAVVAALGFCTFRRFTKDVRSETNAFAEKHFNQL